MNEGLLSRRYAKALLGYADSVGEADALYPQMKVFVRRAMATPALREAMANPVVNRDEKRRLIDEAFEGVVTESLNRFVDLVLDSHRADYLTQMAMSYITLYRQKRGIVVVRLTSARELSTETLERIRRDVTERTHGVVEMLTFIDSSIEGGFVFQVDDLRLDASLRNQMERIRRGFATDNKNIV